MVQKEKGIIQSYRDALQTNNLLDINKSVKECIRFLQIECALAACVCKNYSIYLI